MTHRNGRDNHRFDHGAGHDHPHQTRQGSPEDASSACWSAFKHWYVRCSRRATKLCPRGDTNAAPWQTCTKHVFMCLGYQAGRAPAALLSVCRQRDCPRRRPSFPLDGVWHERRDKLFLGSVDSWYAREDAHRVILVPRGPARTPSALRGSIGVDVQGCHRNHTLHTQRTITRLSKFHQD